MATITGHTKGGDPRFHSFPGCTFTAKPSPGPEPTGQLTLLSTNGTEWTGFLAEAAPYMPVGAITMGLLHALFGTRAGIPLLTALLALLL